MIYYVAPPRVGSDAHGTGSIDNPFQTIGLAASKATQRGDVIIVRQGVYRESVQNISAGVTFQAYPGESITVSGLDIVATPWKLVSGSVYNTGPIPSQGPGQDQVFVDGQIMIGRAGPTPLRRTSSPDRTMPGLLRGMRVFPRNACPTLPPRRRTIGRATRQLW
jgi:hypothetical protein